MSASYPASLKSFTTKTNKVDLVDAAHINSLQEEVVAIETELGTDVAGSCTDLKTRLAVCIAATGAINKGSSFPVSPTPIEGQLFYRTDLDVLYIYDGSGWDAAVPSSDVTIFSWAGLGEDGSVVEYTDDTGYKSSTVTSYNYRYIANSSATNTDQIMQFRWKKLAGINTLTVQAQMYSWPQSNNSYLKVVVGAANGSVTCAGSNSFSVLDKSFTVDVSALTTDTVYDVNIILYGDSTSYTNQVYSITITGGA